MDADALYELVNRVLPPHVVALLALAAALSLAAHAWFKRRPRELLVVAALANIAAVYLWTHLAGLSLTARAIGIRIAIVVLLISILIYSQSAQPDLFKLLRRVSGRVWGSVWKKRT